MMNLQKRAVGPQALEALAALLRDRFRLGNAEEADVIEGVYSMSGGGVNDGNHCLIQTRSGRRFGVKTSSRGGGPDGERRAEAFSRLCEVFGLHDACDAIRVDNVPHLDGFDKSPSVVTEWAPESKRLDEMDAQEKQAMSACLDVLRQAGMWLAINLHFGLGDRGGLKNWVWSQSRQRLTAVDTESAFQSATVQDHYTVVDTVSDRTKIKQERGRSDASKSFEQGLREVHRQVLQHPESIRAMVGEIASAQNYASPVAHLSEDQFVDKVFGELA
jgi:hypothetical protein